MPGDHALILGGQRSGKSRAAEGRARDWLAAGAGREALLIATATAGDEEMRRRIARHRADRLPGLHTLEVPLALSDALRAQSAPRRLLVVDCLTLWLTNLLMPLHGEALDETQWQATCDGFIDALSQATGPVVLVSNEIGLGVMPLSAEARRFADALGLLHQRVAAACGQVTLMVAGLPLVVKAGHGR